MRTRLYDYIYKPHWKQDCEPPFYEHDIKNTVIHVTDDFRKCGDITLSLTIPEWKGTRRFASITMDQKELKDLINELSRNVTRKKLEDDKESKSSKDKKEKEK